MQAVTFSAWESEPDVGYVAAIATRGRTLDLAATPRADGREAMWDVIEGVRRIASGYESTVEAARRAAETAARRALFRVET